MGAGSVSRIRRPMYCTCRFKALLEVIFLCASTACSKSSGRPIFFSVSADRRVSSAPKSCRASICFFFWVLLTQASSLFSGVVFMRVRGR